MTAPCLKVAWLCPRRVGATALVVAALFLPHGAIAAAATKSPHGAKQDSASTANGPNWVDVVTLIVTALGLAGVVYQVRAAREQARGERTAQLFERWRTIEFIEILSRIGPGYLRVNSVDACFARIRAWELAPHGRSKLVVEENWRWPRAKLSEVLHVVNFCEEIGVLYNTKSVAPDQLQRQLGRTLVEEFDHSWWWIHWMRSNRLTPLVAGEPRGHEDESFAEWQRMVEAIERSASRSVAQHRDVWILCLPGSKGTDWPRHRKLSRDLTEAAQDLGRLEAAVPERAEARIVDSKRLNPRVICIPPWQAPRDRQLRVQRLAGDLGALLEHGGLAGLEAVADAARS